MKPLDSIEESVKKMAFQADADLDRRLWAAIAKAHRQFQETQPAWGRSIGRRHIMIASAMKVAAVIAIVGVVVGALVLFDAGATSAFGQVIDTVLRAESVSFTMRQKLGNQPAFVTTIAIGDDRMRMDIIGAEGPQEGVGQLRAEMQRQGIDALVSVLGDVATGQVLELNHLAQTFTWKTMDEQIAAQFASANLIEQFRTLEEESAEWIEETVENGRQLDVYSVTSVNLMGMQGELSGGENDRMRVWVDRETSLPVRILLETSFEAEGRSQDWIEFSDFAWNEPVSGNVLTLTIPEGYREAPPATPN